MVRLLQRHLSQGQREQFDPASKTPPPFRCGRPVRSQRLRARPHLRPALGAGWLRRVVRPDRLVVRARVHDSVVGLLHGSSPPAPALPCRPVPAPGDPGRRGGRMMHRIRRRNALGAWCEVEYGVRVCACVSGRVRTPPATAARSLRRARTTQDGGAVGRVAMRVAGGGVENAPRQLPAGQSVRARPLEPEGVAEFRPRDEAVAVRVNLAHEAVEVVVAQEDALREIGGRIRANSSGKGSSSSSSSSGPGGSGRGRARLHLVSRFRRRRTPRTPLAGPRPAVAAFLLAHTHAATGKCV